jgi:hypothetical protein
MERREKWITIKKILSKDNRDNHRSASPLSSERISTQRFGQIVLLAPGICERRRSNQSIQSKETTLRFFFVRNQNVDAIKVFAGLPCRHIIRYTSPTTNTIRFES